MHSGLHIGWYPLSPLEIYYGNRRWGPYTRVVTQRPPHRHKKRDAYFKNGIIVKKTDLYEAKEGGYTPVKDRHAIIKDARPISIIDRTIIRRTEHRHRYADGEPERKPHKAVIKRIQHRKAKIGKTAPLRVSELKQKLRRIRKGRLRKGNGGIKAPVVIDRIVARSDIDTSDVTFRVVKPRRERMKGIPRPIVEAKKRPIGKIMKKPPSRKPEAGRPVDGKKRRMEKTRQDKEHHRKARTEAEKRRPENARKRPKQIIKADDEEENSSKKTRKDEKPGKSKKPEVNAEEEQKTQEAPLEKHKKRSPHWP